MISLFMYVSLRMHVIVVFKYILHLKDIRCIKAFVALRILTQNGEFSVNEAINGIIT
jgi:hypothetical protein